MTPVGGLVDFGRGGTMHERLAEAMDYVEEKREQLLDSLNGMSEDTLQYRVAEGSWTVAEILEHLRLVESGVARLIAKRVAQARDAGLGEEQSTDSVMPSFAPYRERLESAVLQSPEGVRPRADVDYQGALNGLGISRDALRAAAASANGLALGEIKHTHPILGELDLYQWLLFLGQHEERHRKQIERTLQSIPK
jgi:DinB superfamily